MLKFGMALVASMFAATAANAACTQSNLGGTWQIYSSGWTNQGSWWSRCKVTISATGTMSAGSCVASLPDATGPLTNGSATLTAANTCTYTARFTVGGEVNRVTHATLSKNLEIGSGVGTFPGGAFIFSMTRL